MHLKKIFAFIAVVGVSSVWLMCAGTKPQTGPLAKEEEKQKVDEILDTKKAEAERQKKDEDEVLRMLGISPEQEQAEKQKTAMGEEKAALETKAGSLEEEIARKEREIEKLKQELAEKDRKMAELESVLNDLKSSSRPQASAVAAPGHVASVSGPISFEEYRRRYQQALQEYRNRNYNTAIRMFEELLRIDSNNSLSDNAQYWIGECYYALGMYQRALVEFQKVFAFVNSNKEDDAQLKIALCYKNMNQIENAREALQRLIVKYPKSEYVSMAKRLLAQL